MTEENGKETTKKVTFKEAVQQQLEAKKNKSANQNFVSGSGQSGKKMKSQQAKKVNSAPRKMGS